MVKIGKVPIVKHIINYFKSYGFNDFILATVINVKSSKNILNMKKC